MPTTTSTFELFGGREAPRDAPFRLMVLRGEAVTFHALPARGEVTIGRSEEATICVPDATLSRLHLRLSLGEAVTVADLGSRNGTRVRNERLEVGAVVEISPGDALRPGDIVEAGAVILAVQFAAVGARQPPSASAPPTVGELGDGPLVLDPAMRRLYELLTRVAAGSLSVLLLGETGVGKELAAEHLHKSSPRRGRPFLRLNCASLARSLLESELFGHERGAFTGAVETKRGLLESADGGTVFIDEVGELPTAVQVKLLRVLDERKVTRVGGLQPRAIDIRVVAATNRDLRAEVARGAFRHDLFFRLNGIAFELPPLRERTVEVIPLARYFLRRELPRAAAPPTLTERALAALEAHPWPGNVRELRNVMARAALLADGGAIDVEHLGLGETPLRPRAAPAPPALEAPAAPAASAPPPAAAPEDDGAPRTLREEFASMERQRIVDALAQCSGNQTRAATLLGMPRRTFIARLETYGIARPRKG